MAESQLLEFGALGDDDEQPPRVVVDAPAPAEAPLYMVELRRRRAHVNELAEFSAPPPQPSVQPTDVERRERARAHRYSVRRFLVDTRDQFFLEYPRATTCCWSSVRALLRVASLALVAACAYAVWSLVRATPTLLQTREVASDELSFVRVARFDRIARPFADTCAQLRLRVDERTVRLYTAAAERALTTEPCVCAQLFGVDERILSFSSTHAFNASVVAEPCDGAAALEHFYVDESALRRFYLERTDFSEVVRARCVRVDYLDAHCRPLRAHLTDQQSFCAQTCAQLFDGRY